MCYAQSCVHAQRVAHVAAFRSHGRGDRGSDLRAILKATTVSSSRGELKAIPLDKTIAILKKYNVLGRDKSLPPAR